MTVAPDLVLKALANQERRAVCQYLAGQQAPVTTNEVVARLQAQSADSRSRSQFVVALRHTHLPLLNEANIIEYTRSTERIESGRHLDVASEILDIISRDGIEVV